MSTNISTATLEQRVAALELVVDQLLHELAGAHKLLEDRKRFEDHVGFHQAFEPGPGSRGVIVGL